MKKSLSILVVVLAIFSQAHSINLGRILGIRRNWEEASSRSAAPEIIEVVRWRQPVCVIPGRDVPSCLEGLHKFQNEYERNSAKGIEAQDSKNPAKKQADVLTPAIVDSFNYDNVDSLNLEASDETGRSLDRAVTLNLRSSTPAIDDSSAHREGKYLVMSSFRKAATIVHKTPPAIYVTKVLNSPVTATLVANNCFPDIGVPICDNYQETITIYKKPTNFAEKADTLVGSYATAEATIEDISVQENNDSSDFWSDPNSPHFDDGTAQNEPQRPTGLLGQAIQHVISKPEVINAIPPGVIDAIANNPGILEALANAGSDGVASTTTITETEIKPQIVANSDEPQEIVVTPSISKPGLMGSLLDIQRPAILNNLFNSGFGIFNKSTTSKPATTGADDEKLPTATSHFSGGLLGQGIAQAPFIGAIQDLIYRPETVSTDERPEFKPVLVVEPTKKPGLFENLWNPGNFGIFNRPTKVVASNSEDTPVVQEVSYDEETKTFRPSSPIEVPERTQLSEIFVKPENDISGRPTLPNIFGSADSAERVPKPTQAPGFLGGLFKNPSRPEEVDESVENTKTILGIGSSIFSKPANKPLIIERPGAKPLLVEKPIYVEEKPVASAGFFNFFIPNSDKPLLTVDHEVIKEPVYVYQKPQTSSGIFSNVFGKGASLSGFFQGWAIFGNDNDEEKIDQKQPIAETAEVSPTSENFRTTVVQPVASPIVEVPQDIPEAVPVNSTPLEKADISPESEEIEGSIDDEAIEAIVEALEREEIEDAPERIVDSDEPVAEVISEISLPKATVPVVPVEAAVAPAQVNSPAESTDFLDPLPERFLATLPEDIASKVNAELTGPIEILNSGVKSIAAEPTVETSPVSSESSATEDALKKAEETIVAEEIAAESSKNLAPESESIVKPADYSDEESEIENDA